MILILGGTVEARELAEALGSDGILSLLGVTRQQVTTPHRTGGFGGIAGLKAYIKAKGIRAVIDATHPFAAQMSSNAAAQTLAPVLRLTRPAWPEAAAWISVGTLAEAAAELPAGARVFLSVGARSLTFFLPRDDVWFLVRSIERPAQLPANHRLIQQRPPFELGREIALMRAHKITHIISKNAGGVTTRAKIDAAACLNIPVIMVKRPQPTPVPFVETVNAALEWIKKGMT